MMAAVSVRVGAGAGTDAVAVAGSRSPCRGKPVPDLKLLVERVATRLAARGLTSRTDAAPAANEPGSAAAASTAAAGAGAEAGGGGGSIGDTKPFSAARPDLTAGRAEVSWCSAGTLLALR